MIKKVNSSRLSQCLGSGQRRILLVCAGSDGQYTRSESTREDEVCREKSLKKRGWRNVGQEVELGVARDTSAERPPRKGCRMEAAGSAATGRKGCIPGPRRSLLLCKEQRELRAPAEMARNIKSGKSECMQRPGWTLSGLLEATGGF